MGFNKRMRALALILLGSVWAGGAAIAKKPQKERPSEMVLPEANVIASTTARPRTAEDWRQAGMEQWHKGEVWEAQARLRKAGELGDKKAWEELAKIAWKRGDAAVLRESLDKLDAMGGSELADELKVWRELKVNGASAALSLLGEPGRLKESTWRLLRGMMLLRVGHVTEAYKEYQNMRPASESERRRKLAGIMACAFLEMNAEWWQQSKGLRAPSDEEWLEPWRRRAQALGWD